MNLLKTFNLYHQDMTFLKLIYLLIVVLVRFMLILKIGIHDVC